MQKTNANPTSARIRNELEEFLAQMKLEEILYTKFLSELADQGFTKTEIDQNIDVVKARLKQYVEGRLSTYIRLRFLPLYSLLIICSIENLDESKHFEFTNPNQVWADSQRSQQPSSAPRERADDLEVHRPGDGNHEFANPERVFAEFQSKQTREKGETPRDHAVEGPQEAHRSFEFTDPERIFSDFIYGTDHQGRPRAG